MTSRSEHLTSAVDDLTWLTTIPHTLHQIVGIYAEATAHHGRTFRHGASCDEILRAMATSEGHGKGGHADPTADAALRGQDDAVDDGDETLRQIDAAVEQIAAYLDELGSWLLPIAGKPAPPKVTGRDRTETTGNAASAILRLRPHLEDALTRLDSADVNHADWIIRCVAESASWLRTKAEGIWTAHKGERYTPAVQRAISECSCCGPWRKGTIAPSGGLCEQCGNFKRNHGCLPIREIVAGWELGRRYIKPEHMKAARDAGKRKAKAS